MAVALFVGLGGMSAQAAEAATQTDSALAQDRAKASSLASLKIGERLDYTVTQKVVVQWKCEDIVHWMNLSIGMGAQVDGCSTDEGKLLTGTKLIQGRVKDITLSVLGMSENTHIESLRIAAAGLRRNVSKTPLSFFEWRAANQRLCDFWIVPLMTLSPRSLRIWAKLTSISDDSAIDDYDDWADDTPWSKFLFKTLAVPHWDLFWLSQSLSIPGVADLVLRMAMGLHCLADAANFAMLVMTLTMQHRLPRTVKDALKIELFGLAFASILFTMFDPTWFSDMCLYFVIFVMYPLNLLKGIAFMVAETVELRKAGADEVGFTQIPELLASGAVKYIGVSLIESVLLFVFIGSAVAMMLIVSDADGSHSINALDLLLPFADDDQSGTISTAELEYIRRLAPYVVAGGIAFMFLLSLFCRISLALGRDEKRAELLQADVRSADILYDRDEDFIGKGAFADVYKVEWHGAKVAAKLLRVKPRDSGFSGVVDTLRKEAEQQALLRHPHILTFYGVCLEPHAEPIMLLEYLGGGALSSRLHVFPNPLPPRDVLDHLARMRVARDVAAGLTYLHSKNTAHLDLKPDNVLLTTEGIGKVADFGLATRLKKFHAFDIPQYGVKGTPLYMSPEQHCNIASRRSWKWPRSLSTKSDVFSFGILLNELEVGFTPWVDDNSMLERGREQNFQQRLHDAIVLNNQRPSIAENPDQRLQDIVQDCWKEQAEDRPTMKEVLTRVKGLVAVRLWRRASASRSNSINANNLD